MENEFVTKTLFWIVGILFTVLYGVTAFLLSHYFNKNEKEKEIMKKQIQDNKETVENKLYLMIKDFQAGVESLRAVVVDIKELVSIVKTQHSAEISEINRRLIDKREWLNQHDEVLSRHEKEIVEIKSSCRHYHK